MRKSVFRYFQENVEDYAAVADRVIMRNEELRRELLDALSFPKSAKIDVLDLGSGTGKEILQLLKRYPNAKVKAVYLSSRLIEQAKVILSDFLDRVEFVEGDFSHSDFGGPFDAVISVAAIHNVEDEQKQTVFSRVYDCLKPGGVFVNGDFVAGENEFIDAQTTQAYKDFIRDHLDGEEREMWLRHIEEDDQPMKLSEQYKLLYDCGFSNISLRWLFNNEVVYVAEL